MEELMKKAMLLSIGLVFSFVTVLWISPCLGQDVLQGCAKIKKGQLRIVSNPAECKKSEYAVTINGSAPAANPVPSFAGKVCWNYNQTEDETGSVSAGPFLMTGYVTYLGGERYSVLATTATVPGEVLLLNGAALVIDNNIYISMPSSEQQALGDDDRAIHIHQILLDKTNLNGTLWAVATTYNRGNHSFRQSFTGGNLTKVVCP
jgi:hypothetical protein